MRERLTIFCDGGCDPNPGGLAACAFVVFEGSVSGREFATRPTPLKEQYGCIGEGEGMTNNGAEFRAVRAALKWLLDNAEDVPAEVRTDSQLAVYLVNGRWDCHAEHLIPYRNECQDLLRDLPHASVKWVRREQNWVADALIRKAYVEYRRKAA